jgi:hypothetical protein
MALAQVPQVGGKRAYVTVGVSQRNIPPSEASLCEGCAQLRKKSSSYEVGIERLMDYREDNINLRGYLH